MLANKQITLFKFFEKTQLQTSNDNRGRIQSFVNSVNLELFTVINFWYFGNKARFLK